MFLKTVMVSLIISCAVFASCNEWERKSFESHKWKQSVPLRYAMLHDLVYSKILIDRSADQVISVLGTPENRWDSLQRWRYQAGWVGEGLGLSIYSLFLKFKDGVVDSTFIIKIHD